MIRGSIRCATAVVLAVVTLHAVAAAQRSGTPERAAADFYRWYIAELNAKRFPIDMNRSVLLDKISKRLGDWLYSDAYVYDGRDVFLDAEDWEDSWAKNVSASPVSSQRDAAEVKVTLRPSKGSSGDSGMHVLHVRMVKEGRLWRIDRAENRKWVENKESEDKE